MRTKIITNELPEGITLGNLDDLKGMTIWNGLDYFKVKYVEHYDSDYIPFDDEDLTKFEHDEFVSVSSDGFGFHVIFHKRFLTGFTH